MNKNKYNRLKEDPSQLQMFADEVIDNINNISPETTALVYRFEEAAVLTQEIYDSLKTGDVILVNNMQFIISKPNITPRRIMGKMVGTTSTSSISVIDLDWTLNGELEPSLTTMKSQSVVDYGEIDSVIDLLTQNKLKKGDLFVANEVSYLVAMLDDNFAVIFEFSDDPTQAVARYTYTKENDMWSQTNYSSLMTEDDARDKFQSKLYLHTITDSANGYQFSFISPTDSPVPFDTFNVHQHEWWNWMKTIVYFDFKFIPTGSPMLFATDLGSGIFYTLNYGQTGLVGEEFDDIALSSCSDTVTPL